MPASLHRLSKLACRATDKLMAEEMLAFIERRGAIQSDALTLRLFVIRPVGSDWRASRFCRT
jgi:hypothetical protein